MATLRLPFEKEIYQLEDGLTELESRGQAGSEEIRLIDRVDVELSRETTRPPNEITTV